MRNLEKVVSMLGALTREELIELRGIIDDILAIESQDAQPGPTTQTLQVSGAAGHIELKMIRGYGPYKYLRRWRGGVLTSSYLGKAKKG